MKGTPRRRTPPSAAGDLDAQFQRLGRTGAGDQEQRAVEADVKAAQFHFLPFA